MKVLVLHNRYQQRGGEDAVVDNEIQLLRDHGQTVFPLIVSNNELKGTLPKIRAALYASYSAAFRSRLSAILKAEKPDVVHVHNFFPLVTPSAYDACRSHDIPVVQTLHNYRITCANGILTRDHRPCEDCVGGSPYQGAVHRCYRGSAIASLPVARMIAKHRTHGTWSRNVTRYIAPSEFTRAKMAQAGLPVDRILVKPHVILSLDPGRPPKRSPRQAQTQALYVGRLSPEKGVRTLIEAWKRVPFALEVVGTGPLEQELKNNAPSHVRFAGVLSPEHVREKMMTADFLVAPSETYETFGLAAAEAFSCGLPVLASDLGSLKELIEPGKTGLHFTSGNAASLAQNAVEMCRSPERLLEMGNNAFAACIQKCAPKTNFERLMEIYRQALA